MTLWGRFHPVTNTGGKEPSQTVSAHRAAGRGVRRRQSEVTLVKEGERSYTLADLF